MGSGSRLGLIALLALGATLVACGGDADDAAVREGFPPSWPVPSPPGSLDCAGAVAQETKPGTVWVADLCLDGDSEAAVTATETYLGELDDAGLEPEDPDEFVRLLRTTHASAEHAVVVQLRLADGKPRLTVEVSTR